MGRVIRPEKKDLVPRILIPVSLSGIPPLYYICGRTGVLTRLRILTLGESKEVSYTLTSRIDDVETTQPLKLKANKTVDLPDVDVVKGMTLELTTEDVSSNIVYISFDVEI